MSFPGHMDHGTVFICVSLWWLYNMCKNYVKCIEEGKPYRTQVSYPATIRGHTIHLEVILKIGFPATVLMVELIRHASEFIDENGNFHFQTSMQHITIYSIFILHGVTDLMDCLRLSSLRDVKFVTFGLAFAWYGVVFNLHNDPNNGKTPLLRMTHSIPVGLVFINALVLFVEIFKRDCIVFQMIRCYVTLTWGTWFCYITTVLRTFSPFPGREPNPAWDQNNMGNVHFMVTAFGIHLAANLLIMMASFYIAESYRKCLKCIRRGVPRGIVGSKGRLSSHHYEKVKLIESDDPIVGED